MAKDYGMDAARDKPSQTRVSSALRETYDAALQHFLCHGAADVMDAERKTAEEDECVDVVC